MMWINISLIMVALLFAPYEAISLQKSRQSRVSQPIISSFQLKSVQCRPHLDTVASTRVIHSAILGALPWFEVHHIVLLQDKENPQIACAIDFSPSNQKPETLSKLLLGQYVPAEVRVNWLSGVKANQYSIICIIFYA